MKTRARCFPSLLCLFVLTLDLTFSTRGQVPATTSSSQFPDLRFELTFLIPGPNGASPVTQQYTLAGPGKSERLIPGSRLIRDPKGTVYFGTDGQSIFTVTPLTGAKTDVTIPAGLPSLSHPASFTYDTKRAQFLLASFGGLGYLYSYSPDDSQWELVSSLDNIDLDSIAYDSADDRLYGVQTTQGTGNKLGILAFGPNGNVVDTIADDDLTLAVSPAPYKSELIALGRYLVLLLEPRTAPARGDESRIYLIDTTTRQFFLTYRKIWPGSVPQGPVITSPPNGSSYTIDKLPPIIATSPLPVLSIELFANGQSIAKGQSTSGLMNFQSTWKNAVGGNYTLLAVSRDFQGQSRTSAPVMVHLIEQLQANVGYQLTFALVGVKPSPTNIFSRFFNSGEPSQNGLLLPAMRVFQDPTSSRYGYGVWEHVPYKVDLLHGTMTLWRAPAPLPPVSGSSAVAADTKRKRVLLATTGSGGYLYAYSPRDDSWSVLSPLNSHTFSALIYNPQDDSLYGLETNPSEGHLIIDRLSPDGAYRSSFVLPRLPFANIFRTYRSEFFLSGTTLGLILEDNVLVRAGQAVRSYIYTIDLRTGTAMLSYVGFAIASANALPALSSANSLPAASLTISSEGEALIQLHQAADGSLESTTDLTAPDWTPFTQSGPEAVLPATNAHQFFRVLQ